MITPEQLERLPEVLKDIIVYQREIDTLMNSDVFDLNDKPMLQRFARLVGMKADATLVAHHLYGQTIKPTGSLALIYEDEDNV